MYTGLCGTREERVTVCIQVYTDLERKGLTYIQVYTDLERKGLTYRSIRT